LKGGWRDFVVLPDTFPKSCPVWHKTHWAGIFAVKKYTFEGDAIGSKKADAIMLFRKEGMV